MKFQGSSSKTEGGDIILVIFFFNPEIKDSTVYRCIHLPYKGFRKNAITQKVIGIFLVCKNYVKENVVGYIIRPYLFFN